MPRGDPFGLEEKAEVYESFLKEAKCADCRESMTSLEDFVCVTCMEKVERERDAYKNLYENLLKDIKRARDAISNLLKAVELRETFTGSLLLAHFQERQSEIEKEEDSNEPDKARPSSRYSR